MRGHYCGCHLSMCLTGFNYHVPLVAFTYGARVVATIGARCPPICKKRHQETSGVIIPQNY